MATGERSPSPEILVQARADKTIEARLVARARGGDRQAFEHLIELYAPQVYNLSVRITGSPDDAEDCVQETFLRAFGAMSSFRGEATFFTWLYRVALNVARDAAKRRARGPLPASDLPARSGINGDEGDPASPDRAGELADEGRARVVPENSHASWSVEPEEAMLAEQRRTLILAAISSLPPHHREVVVLYDLQGLSYEEIARITRTRVGTVKSRLNRARLALKDRLMPHMELLRS